jgi:hypothetical protein
MIAAKSLLSYKVVLRVAQPVGFTPESSKSIFFLKADIELRGLKM